MSGMTQREVAEVLGISQVRVHAIEHAALRKLRSNPDVIKLWELVKSDAAEVQR